MDFITELSNLLIVLGIFIESAILASFLAIAVFLFLNLLFSYSLYKSLKKIPSEKRFFPAWFVWLFFIPIIGYIFYWLMLPFGIPKTFRQATLGNKEANKRTNTLFFLGLIFCLLPLLIIIPYGIFILILPCLTIGFIYWAKVLKFRKLYLQ